MRARQILLSERDQPFIDQSKALSYLELHAKGKRDYSNELWPPAHVSFMV